MLDHFLDYFICGHRFQKVADVVVDSDHNNILQLLDKQIIWCKTDYVVDLFRMIKYTPERSYILITHNSDYPIDERLFYFKPPCIKKWFAQNVNYKHPDLIPLPIGLENDQGPSKGPSLEPVALSNLINKPFEMKIRDKLYCNIGNTYYAREAINLSLSVRPDVVMGSKKPFRDYIADLLQYKFIVSPRGNGIDCHRTWESLYLGSIPLVDEHFMFDTYQLPIIQVKNWNNVSVEFVEQELKKLMLKERNYDQLNINWWFEKIKKEKELLTSNEK